MFWSILCLFKSWYKCGLDLCSWYQTKVTIYINWDHLNFSSIQPLNNNVKVYWTVTFYTTKSNEAGINVTECGFRQNWLCNGFDSSLSISRGKKFDIINHTHNWYQCAVLPAHVEQLYWVIIQQHDREALIRALPPSNVRLGDPEHVDRGLVQFDKHPVENLAQTQQL